MIHLAPDTEPIALQRARKLEILKQERKSRLNTIDDDMEHDDDKTPIP